MTEPDISGEIRQFILDKIDSVSHLEALLLISADPRRLWTEKSLAQALYLQPALTRAVIRGLARRGWIEHRSHRQIKYDSAWDPGGAFITKLAESYRRNLVRIATLIHTNASAAVRDFADAFHFKKE